MVLYRKYRPQTFEEIIGQEHIIQSLTNALLGASLAHAYLFAGPRGTGKTSVARILARAVNCSSAQGFEPCNQCETCLAILKNKSLDLIEIDAASNRGIEEIRLLKEQTKLKPIRAEYKVFIIDEVHMLTREAFNALLKTLEEPPSRVIFVLATTEVHKVPETILSRVQRFDFKLLNSQELKKYLQRITDKEKVSLDAEMVDFVLRKAQGSARDAAGILEQIIVLNESNPEKVKSFFGVLDQTLIQKFIKYLWQGRARESLELLYKLCEQGISLDNFIQQILETLQKSLKSKLKQEEGRDDFLSQAGIKDILKFIEIFLEAKNNYLASDVLPTLPLEIAVAKICPSQDLDRRLGTEKSAQGLEAEDAPLASAPLKNNFNQPDQTSVSFSKEVSLKEIKEKWPKILKSLKSINSGFAVCFNFAYPLECKDNKLKIAFQHNFHYQYIIQKDKQRILQKKLKEILGKDMMIETILKEQKKDSMTKKALEIFGGEVVS